jgi:hypothetical protein
LHPASSAEERKRKTCSKSPSERQLMEVLSEQSGWEPVSLGVMPEELTASLPDSHARISTASTALPEGWRGTKLLGAPKTALDVVVAPSPCSRSRSRQGWRPAAPLANARPWWSGLLFRCTLNTARQVAVEPQERVRAHS